MKVIIPPNLIDGEGVKMIPLGEIAVNRRSSPTNSNTAQLYPTQSNPTQPNAGWPNSSGMCFLGYSRICRRNTGGAACRALWCTTRRYILWHPGASASRAPLQMLYTGLSCRVGSVMLMQTAVGWQVVLVTCTRTRPSSATSAVGWSTASPALLQARRVHGSPPACRRCRNT